MDPRLERWLRAYVDHPTPKTPLSMTWVAVTLEPGEGWRMCPELTEMGYLTPVQEKHRKQYVVTPLGRAWVAAHPLPPEPRRFSQELCPAEPESGQLYLRALCEMWVAEDLRFAVASAAVTLMRMRSPADARRYLRDEAARVSG